MNYGSPENRALAIRTLDNAQRERELSLEARRLLETPIVLDLMAEARGVSYSEVPGRVATIVTILVDNSGSMFYHADAVRQGHERAIDIIRQESYSPQNVLLSTQLLNPALLSRRTSVVVDPYALLSDAARLNTENYSPRGGTPLVTRTIETLGVAFAKYREGRDVWKQVTTATIIMSDGEDESFFNGRSISPERAATLIKEMIATERHLIAAMGFGGDQAHFRTMFERMGIDPQWILTLGSTNEDILRALGLFAKAAAQATYADKLPLLLKSGFAGLSEI